MTEHGVAWTLKLSSFAGLVPGASHWMVRLAGKTEDVEVAYRMDVDDARALSSYDFTEKPGNITTRFLSEQDARAGGIAAFERLAGEHDVLICELDEDEVLAGPDVLVAEGRAAAAGGDEWWQWKQRFEKHLHPTRYGYGAPPSLRRDLEVVLDHDGQGGWTVAEVTGG